MRIKHRNTTQAQQEWQQYEAWMICAQMMLKFISRKYKLEKWNVSDREALSNRKTFFTS